MLGQLPTAMVLGAWVATGLTLFIFSFLYKDNPLFKVGEHLYVGVSVGYSIVLTYYTVFIRLLSVPLSKEITEKPMAPGSYVLLIPALLGLLMWARFIPKIAWLSRISFAFVVGFGSGVGIPRIVSSYILKQIEDTVNPLITLVNGGLSFSMDFAVPQSGINTIILVIGVTSVLFYFFFSIEHTGPANIVARTGIFFLMIAFGAAFGYTVMSRMSLLIGRFNDLLSYSSRDFGYPAIVLLIFIIIGIWYWQKGNERKPTP